MTTSAPPRRGCVYFNFGKRYALHLVVSVHSLRRHYDGPVTVFLLDEPHTAALKRDLEKLGASVVVTDRLSKSGDRHLVFRESPYETTLLFDSDIVFRAPIDDLWEPLEREGALVTRFFPDPKIRIWMVDKVKPLIGAERHERVVRRITDERLDINVGVMGVSRPRGDGFLDAWGDCMERGRDGPYVLLDEMSVVALFDEHPHYLADEMWNCPADEMFRRTDPAHAKILHYFMDAVVIDGRRMGRNMKTWAGQRWRDAYLAAKADVDLKHWRMHDTEFPRDAEAPFVDGIGPAVRYWLRDSERALRRLRRSLLARPEKQALHPR